MRFIFFLTPAQEELLQLLGHRVTVDRRIDNALDETGRNEGKGGGIDRFTNGRHLHDDVFARAAFFEHAHDGTHLAVGPLDALRDRLYLIFVLQDVRGRCGGHISYLVR
jgi:hypothetical protein